MARRIAQEAALRTSNLVASAARFARTVVRRAAVRAVRWGDGADGQSRSKETLLHHNQAVSR
jgi:hypothetical protein